MNNGVGIAIAVILLGSLGWLMANSFGLDVTDMFNALINGLLDLVLE